MKFTILPEKKKRIKAISQASKELNYKVFLADENDAVLMAAFAFYYEAKDYVTRMTDMTKAEYTIVYTPSKSEDEHPQHEDSKLGQIINNLIPQRRALTVPRPGQVELAESEAPAELDEDEDSQPVKLKFSEVKRVEQV